MIVRVIRRYDAVVHAAIIQRMVYTVLPRVAAVRVFFVGFAVLPYIAEVYSRSELAMRVKMTLRPSQTAIVSSYESTFQCLTWGDKELPRETD